MARNTSGSRGNDGRDQSANPQARSQNWWKIDGKQDTASTLAQHVDELQNLTAGRIRMHNSNVETYNAPERGANGAYGGFRSGYRSARTGSMNKSQLALPVVWSVIQALASEILANEPAPQFLTSGGDYTARREAELLTNLTNGVAYTVGWTAKAADIFFDSCVGGTGFAYLEKDVKRRRIICERVYPAEIVTDPNDDIYAAPRSKYRFKYIDRDELAERYPKADKQKLKTARTLSGLLTTGNAQQTNMVKVYFGWHLPSAKDAGDGRYVVCTSNDSLVDEKYERDWIPLIPFRYDKRLMGYWGLGLPELLGCIQNHLNEILFAYQQAMSKHGVPHWLVHTSANINKQELNDLIGSAIYWSGQQKPELAVWPSMPPDVMEMIQFDLDQIYKMSGVSLMAASAMKPSGLDSGEAIRAYVDTNSARFQSLGKNWERFHCEVFSRMAELAQEVATEAGSYPVRVLKGKYNDHSLEVLDWKTAKKLETDKWQIECFPVSSLPKTPTGKLQYVKDLAEIGPDVLAGLDIVELLQLPDTSGYLNLALAGRRLTQSIVADILDNGRYTPPPDDAIPVDWSLIHVTQVLAKAELEHAPKDRLVKLRMWQAQLVQMKTQNEAPPQQTAPIVPPPPGAPVGPGALAVPALPIAAPQAPLAPVAQPGQ